MAGKWLKLLALGAVLAMSTDAKMCRRKTSAPQPQPVVTSTSAPQTQPTATGTTAPAPTTSSPSGPANVTVVPMNQPSSPATTQPSTPSGTNASTPAATDEAANTPSAGGLGIKMCQLPQYNLQTAAADSKTPAAVRAAIKTVLKNGPATWYTDKIDAKSVTTLMSSIQACSADSTVLVVVYGLPNKDCAAGLSSGGVNKNAADYKAFVQKLATAVGNHKAIYIMEPDAVGLSQDGNCGAKNGYIENVAAGVSILSKNPNANIYMDIGYWNLQDARLNGLQADIIKKMGKTGRIKGIALNTSNYRPNKEISQLCANFQKAYGDTTNFKCVIDTSRNYVENPPSTDWCNQLWAGVGHPPTHNTGYANLDYMMWIKPVGESDGTCNGGPDAGEFFEKGFVDWWNNGYYVKSQGMAKI